MDADETGGVRRPTWFIDESASRDPRPGNPRHPRRPRIRSGRVFRAAPFASLAAATAARRAVSTSPYPRVASFKTADALRAHLRSADIALALDTDPPSGSSCALAQPIVVNGVRVG